MSLFSTLSKAFTIGSAVIGAAGKVSAGRATGKAGEAAARESTRSAAEERRVTEDDVKDVERRLSAVAARNRAARAASGITETGSVKSAKKAFAVEVALQLGKIRRGGESRATAFEQQAAQQRRVGKSGKRAGFIGAGTTLLTAGAEVFG